MLEEPLRQAVLKYVEGQGWGARTRLAQQLGKPKSWVTNYLREPDDPGEHRYADVDTILSLMRVVGKDIGDLVAPESLRRLSAATPEFLAALNELTAEDRALVEQLVSTLRSRPATTAQSPERPTIEHRAKARRTESKRREV